jgi:hypothetical protein
MTCAIAMLRAMVMRANSGGHACGCATSGARKVMLHACLIPAHASHLVGGPLWAVAVGPMDTSRPVAGGSDNERIAPLILIHSPSSSHWGEGTAPCHVTTHLRRCGKSSEGLPRRPPNEPLKETYEFLHYRQTAERMRRVCPCQTGMSVDENDQGGQGYVSLFLAGGVCSRAKSCLGHGMSDLPAVLQPQR